VVLLAFFFGLLTLFAAYQPSWWLIAPQGVACVLCILIAVGT
jgi:hypothetical protein